MEIEGFSVSLKIAFEIRRYESRRLVAKRF